MSKGRKILKSITHTLGNYAYKRKFKNEPEFFFTLKEICENVGIDIESLDSDIKINLNKTISYICRYGDRFTKNCVCVIIKKVKN